MKRSFGTLDKQKSAGTGLFSAGGEGGRKEISKNTKTKSASYYPLMTARYSSRRLLMQKAPNRMSLAGGGDAASSLIGFRLYGALRSQNILLLWDRYSAVVVESGSDHKIVNGINRSIN